MSYGPKSLKQHPAVRLRTLILFVVLVIGLQVLGAYLEIRFLKNWQERSNFGEMFGSINTLFSGLAFAGVIYTILLQRAELELQRVSLQKSTQLMSLTTKLSALNSLVEARSRQIVEMRVRKDPPNHIAPVKAELDSYLLQIKNALEEMNALQ